MNYANKLVLGTVQFGLDYGVNNQSGQVQQSEVNKILQLAKESGIKKIDTSSAYGTSESVLGKSLSENNLQFHIISKYPQSENPAGKGGGCHICFFFRETPTEEVIWISCTSFRVLSVSSAIMGKNERSQSRGKDR